VFRSSKNETVKNCSMVYICESAVVVVSAKQCVGGRLTLSAVFDEISIHVSAVLSQNVPSVLFSLFVQVNM